VQIRIEVPPGDEWLVRAIRSVSRRMLMPYRVVGWVFLPIGLLLGLAALADPALAIMAIVLVVVSGLMFWAAWRTPRQAMRRQPRYMKAEPMTMEITERGLSQVYPSVRVNVVWPAFERAVETRDLFLLYLGPLHAFYVPISLLADADRAQLRTFLVDRGLLRPRPPRVD
jgi:hypothetical protein